MQLLALAVLVLGASGGAPRRVGLRAPRVFARMTSNQLSLADLEPVGSAAYLRAEVAELLDREWIKQVGQGGGGGPASHGEGTLLARAHAR